MFARIALARPRLRWAALLLAPALAIGASLALGLGRGAAASSSVSIQSFSFNPNSVTVAVGDTVTWTNNQAGVPHTVTADAGAFDSGTLASGNSFSFTFTTPGTFAYHCNIHPNMHGTVTVTAAGGGSTPPTSNTPAPTVSSSPATTGAHLAPVHAGVNLIGVPAGTAVTGATAIYELNDAGDGYDLVGPDDALDPGEGYWAFFAADGSIMLPAGSNSPVTETATAGRWLLIGDPSGTLPAKVTGADAVFTFDPVAGQYTATTTLMPGQGAWAYSARGGTITITPTQPATPTPTPQQTMTPQTTAPSNTTPANNTPPMNTQPQPYNPMPMGGGMPGPYHY